MERLALLPGGPEASLEHPGSQRLAAHLDAVPLVQRFDGQRRSEVSVLGSDKFECILSNTLVRAMVGRLTAALMDQPAATVIPVAQQQPAHLPHRHIQHGRSRSHRAPSRQNFRQHFDPLQIAFAHHHPAQLVPPKL